MEKRYCGKCGTQLNEKGLCPKCDKINVRKKNILLLIIITVICVVTIIVVSICLLKDGNVKNTEIYTMDNNVQNVETQEEVIPTYLNYFENADQWTDEYGFFESTNFEYYDNISYCNSSNKNLGSVSAYEFDCNSDGNNELITLSLLPNENNGLYLIPSLYTNVNEIKKEGKSLKCYNDKYMSEVPVLRSSVGVSSILSFVDNNKLFIINDSQIQAEIGAGSVYSDIYIYDIKITGITLLRHYYLYFDNWNCSIGEITQNKIHKYTENDFVDYTEWKDYKKDAVEEMKSDLQSLGINAYFASNNQLEKNDWLDNDEIYDDQFFENKNAEKLLFIYKDLSTDLPIYNINDFTELKNKIN